MKKLMMLMLGMATLALLSAPPVAQAQLAEADAGILFRPPDTIIKEFPQFPVTRTFAELKEQFCKAGGLRP